MFSFKWKIKKVWYEFNNSLPNSYSVLNEEFRFDSNIPDLGDLVVNKLFKFFYTIHYDILCSRYIHDKIKYCSWIFNIFNKTKLSNFDRKSVLLFLICNAKYSCDYQNGFWENLFFGSPEKLLKWISHWKNNYNRQYIDIFVEFGEQPSKYLILINIDTRQYFFNIFQYFNKCYKWEKINIFSFAFLKYSATNDILSIFFNVYQYINKCYIIDGK
jgi:hypothetical protein